MPEEFEEKPGESVNLQKYFAIVAAAAGTFSFRYLSAG